MSHPGSTSTGRTSDGAPAAVALLAESGRIERATSLFRDRFGAAEEALTSHGSEVEEILTGRLGHGTLRFDGAVADVCAVETADGRRHALLSVPAGEHDGDHDPARPLLDEIDASQAIVWLKDMDGRYTLVNRAFAQQLGTGAEHLCGRTEQELAYGESIDGLRQRAGDGLPEEPLELEYTVPASARQPAFAVLRFALRDESGEPVAVCGVAAPLAQAGVARSECARLMKIHRWSRLDEAEFRDELLDEWGLVPLDAGEPEEAPEPEERAEDETAAVHSALEAERQTVAALRGELRAFHAARQEQLDEERSRVQQAHLALGAARARVEQASAELERHRRGEAAAREAAEAVEARAAEAEARAAKAEARAAEADARAAKAEAAAREAEAAAREAEAVARADQAKAAEAETKAAEAETKAAEAETKAAEAEARAGAAPAAPPAAPPSWDASAHRALAAALVGVTEWRTVLDRAVKTLGSQGMWDAAIAWGADERRGVMKCVATWMGDGRDLSSFESRAWQHRQDVVGTEFGRARNRSGPTCLLELHTAEDPLLRAAADQGMASALLLSIQDGNQTIGMLELLSRTATPPAADLMVSLETISLTLKVVAQLISDAATPRWRVGRL